LLKYTWPYVVELKNHTRVCQVVNLSDRPITWHYVGSASKAYYESTVFYYPQLYSFNNNKAAKNMNATAGGLWPGCLAPAWLSFKLSAQLK